MMNEKNIQLSINLETITHSTAVLCEICDFEMVSDDLELSCFYVLLQANKHAIDTGHKIFFRETTVKETTIIWDRSDKDTVDLRPKKKRSKKDDDNVSS